MYKMIYLKTKKRREERKGKEHWKIVATMAALLSGGENPFDRPYPLIRRLSGPHRCSGFRGNERKSLPLPGIKSWTFCL
jgi:hypothetical protein